MRIKYKVYISLLLICFLSSTSNGGTGRKTFFNGAYVSSLPCEYIWSAQNSGATNVINTIKAVSDNICWAAGNSYISKTTDGGLNWTTFSIAGQITGNIFCMDAIDANTAFISTSTSTTYIYKTTNGGTNWTQVFVQAGGFINGIHMINETTGYAAGDPVGGVWTLLKSTNGGNNWTQMPSAPVQYNNEFGFNNSFCIVNNSLWFGTSSTQIYYSTNLGINWYVCATPGVSYCYTLHFNNDTVGIAAGPIALITTNGGLYWSPMEGTIHGTGDIFGAEGYGADYFWAIRDSSIFITTNAGTSWDEVSGVTPTGILYAMDFSISGGCPSGWVASSNGSIYSMKLLTAIKKENNQIPLSYKLYQNYPNPFNPSTKIKFSIPVGNSTLEGGKGGDIVKLTIYDIIGKEITTIINQQLQPGTYEVEWNAGIYPSSVYFYRLISDGVVIETKKMVMLK